MYTNHLCPQWSGEYTRLFIHYIGWRHWGCLEIVAADVRTILLYGL